MENGFKCRIENQNASGVCPDRLRPDKSVMVPEIMSGSSKPNSSKTCLTANPAALALKGVEYGFNQYRIRAAFDQAACLLRAGFHQFIESDVAETWIIHIR